MEVEEEASKQEIVKRKAEILEERESDDFYLNFFEHFTVPDDAWSVIQKFQEAGIIYRHRVSNRLIMLIKHVNALTNATVCYDLYFRQRDDALVIPFIRLEIDANEAPDDKLGKVIHALAQIDEQYENAEERIEESDALPHFYDFLRLLKLSSFNILNESVAQESASKKRRG